MAKFIEILGTLFNIILYCESDYSEGRPDDRTADWSLANNAYLA